MSIYFSKGGLNTYCGTPYFRSQLPPDYPLWDTLEKCRAARRLPPNLRQLSALAKRWAERHGSDWTQGMAQLYDAQGFEIDPNDGHRLTDAEIDAQWDHSPAIDGFKVKDIPIPRGGFADPDTWEVPAQAPEPVYDGPELTVEKLASDVSSHGVKRTAEAYGIPEQQLRLLLLIPPGKDRHDISSAPTEEEEDDTSEDVILGVADGSRFRPN